ncbi:MAG: oligosaccharide flippase family protein, partial [Candidatus Veblenbacteria bacterium]|nr:oligosaccharide flippase family protein [Candidatus Veblenbacteria bacterium]
MYQAIARQSALQLVAKIIATAIGLAVVALTTRALGPAGFGSYTTIITFLQFAGILADLGLTMVASRSLGEGNIPRPTLLGNILSFRVTTAAIAFALAPVAALA